MGAGWIARGADTPAPASGGEAAPDVWSPVGPDAPTVPSLVRAAPKPMDTSRGLLSSTHDVLFGHEPKNSQDPDQHYAAGILPSVGETIGGGLDRLTSTSGPDISTLAKIYPHLVGAQFENVKAGYQEGIGAHQVRTAERQLAGFNILPQVAARIPGDYAGPKIDEIAKDPLVAKTARSLGISPQEFAADWGQYANMTPEEMGDQAARAKDTLAKGQASVVAGKGTRNQAWADERVWQPTDAKNGKLDPWSAKGIAFNTALAIPELAAVAGATAAGTAVGGPPGGMAAGAGTAVALFAPAQRAEAKNKIDDQVNRLLEKADQLDDAAPIGGKRGLNPVTGQLRQQAADLAASSDKIANTAGFLYAVGDAAGALPVASVLTRSPAGKAVLDRIVGAAIAKTVGGRIAGTMVANGAGGMLQASIQKAVDAGIVHENTPLKDALADIAYTGVVSAATALPFAAAHEVAGAPARAQARRDLESDELLKRVKAASDALGGEDHTPGETYPGYRWNESAKRYEPTGPSATNARIGATKGPAGETIPPKGETPPGAPGARQSYQAKTQTLNEAATAAEKRSDVTLEPEENGWSVHVKGQPMATFDTVDAAREAMAQARKVVGTKPVAPENPESTPSAASDLGAASQKIPETPLDVTQPIEVERRSATDLRTRVGQMTPEQMKAALLTHELTGIPNRRAYVDSVKKPAQVSVDIDSLKWLNDNASHEGGDQLLKTVAQALHEESGGNAYHISGDEFVVQGASHEEAESAMARAKERLAGATLTFAHPDGRTIELQGVGLSHGTGNNLRQAESALSAAKQGRETEGLRAARGEQPPNARITPREAGLPAGGGAPAQVLGQEVKPPHKPTVGQAAAGNYFKPSVQWHGIPIKVENLKGQYRRFIDAKTGKPGRRQMRADYGYIPGTKGNDEDGVDIMMGPHKDTDKAYVIDQLDHTGKKFDEHKIQVGVRSEEEARAQYLSHYPAGWKGLGGITEVNPEQLKRWLNEGDLTKPIDAESVPREKAVRGPGPDPRHDSVLEFLARHSRGLDREEAEAQGIDPADMALSAAHVGIKRAFRKGGLSFDHAAEALHEAGYPVTDAQGRYSPNALLDKIDSELRGQKVYSSRSEAQVTQETHSWRTVRAEDWRTPLTDEELSALTPRQAQMRLEALQHEQERLEREIERAGLSGEATERESEADLERIPFQRREGGQQDLFGDVVHVKNELKRLEAALDKKRSSGQESVETGRADDLFSAARKQMDLPKIGEETTRYAVRQPSPSSRALKNVRSGTGVPQLDLFANAATPAPAVQAARLAQSVKLVHIGEFRSGVDRVKNWQDAAHIIAPLRKYPQENVTALVLDKAGKPLAVIRHSIGHADQAAVEPWSLAGSVVQVPGAAQVYFAHNHPSGYVGQSQADTSITVRLHQLLEGSGIEPKGMIVVGPNRITATYFNPKDEVEHTTDEMTKARRSGAVSLKERRFGRLGGRVLARHNIQGADQARAAIKESGETSGVILMNNRHQVVGVVPMDPAEMAQLRTGSVEHGAARLLKAMAEANANAIISFGPAPGARNVAVFGNAAGVKALDAMTLNEHGELESSAVRGEMPSHMDDAFLQRQFKPPAGLETGKPGSMSVPEVRAHVDKILSGFAVKPEVVIAKDLAELQADPVVGHILGGYKSGDVIGFVHPPTRKIYLVADQFRGPHDVSATIAHEYITHFGLRAAMGDANEPRYQAILDGVRKAMPAEFRSRGESEFPGTFNSLNAHHRNRAAEEVLAYYGQRYAHDQSVPARIQRWLDKLFAMLRDWWRSAWGLPKKFDELFVRRTLADLESFLRRGEAGAKEAPRPSTETEPAFAGKQDTFFSGLAKAVDAAKREKGTGAEWEATLRNMPGVKPEEMQWTGLKDWLEGRGRVSKDEIAEFVHAHTVHLGEVNLSDSEEQHQVMLDQALEKIGWEVRWQDGDHWYIDPQGVEHEAGELPTYVEKIISDIERGGPTKYKTWATPGGENYRELLMTLTPRANIERMLAERKKVFDAWAPKIAEIDKLLDDHLYGRGAAAGMSLKDLQEKRDQYTEMRDNEADDRAGAVKEGDFFRSSHWDEKNVLAHVRFDDRTGPNGERVLHLHELQSDWHQKGRREGYIGKEQPHTELDKLYERFMATRHVARTIMERNDNLGFESAAEALRAVGTHDDWAERWPDLNEEDLTSVRNYVWARRIYQRELTAEGRDPFARTGTKVPDAPFKTTWPELAIKRMLRYAAENGYDALSWDTGDTNAERYNMQQIADKITIDQHETGVFDLIARKGDKTVVESRNITDEKLAQYVGKDMAQKAAQQQGLSTFTGDALKVGGAGMRGFYDDILPKKVQAIVKRFGSNVEPGTVTGTLAHNGTRSVVDDQGGVSFTSEHEQIPAHMVKITPAMRDSVMGGQPMFLKRRKGSTGTEPPAPKKGAYALARRAIAAIPNNEFTLSLRRIADPAGVSEASKATAIVTREALGELAQSSEEALQNLERYSKQFDLLGTEDRYAFIDAMEGGKAQGRSELQPAADAIRKLLDDWRERIRGLGVGALDNFIENYFPHIWQNDAKAKKFFGQIFGRRPLKGPASFLKERTIPTTREGLDAGLTPISTNPLVLAFAKLREMQRFYTGVKLMQRFKDEGLAKFLPSGKLRPDDWAEINDAVGRVRQWSETEKGFIERGHYIMPSDAARVINNHLSASALRNFLPAQVFRSLSNAANALQLGFSAFHLGFTTLDAVISKNALAIERLLHGEPLRAAQAFLEASTGIGGAGMNILRGHRLLKAYTNIGAASPEMRRIVEGLTAAGGRVKMDNYFQAAQGLSPFKGVGFATLASDIKAALTKPRGEVESLTKVLTSFPQQYATRLWRDLEAMAHELPVPVLQMPLEIAGRMTRASTSIIMEHIVPLQKLGVFSDLAADHIRRNPLEDPVAFADAMQKIWNSVDNRLGEMVYDNVFWNRTFKDVNHMMVRAVGWNLGTIRELFGAPVDVIKVLDYMARGAPAELGAPPLSKTAQARLDYEAQKSTFQRIAEKVGHKIPYTLALIGTTMVLGAALTYLFTGKGPEEIKDYFFPRTGRKTKYGTPERISMPSYAKDLYEYGTQPVTTVINKANPIFGIIHAIYANEDFFGNAVRDPDAGFFEQLIDGAKYAGRQVQPFSLQGTKQFVGAGEMDTRGKTLSTMPYVGFGPAPARVTSPEQMERYQLREKEKSYIRGLQRQLRAATERGDKEEVNRLREEIRDSKLKERGTEHEIRGDKVKARETAEKISSLVEGRSRLEAVAALREAGLPAFAQLWASMPDRPKPRVIQSLEEFA